MTPTSGIIRAGDFVVAGTDTDAGKTTFSLLWLAAFDSHAYWKPLETGPGDTARVRKSVPSAVVFEPVARFDEPVAPPLAARRAGSVIPAAAVIAAARPRTHQPLLIESFGGPLSPLNETELQIELFKALQSTVVLITGSAVGAVGRALASLRVLRADGVAVAAVVLIGPRDDFAVERIARDGDVEVISLTAPTTWDAVGIREAAESNRPELGRLASLFGAASPGADASGSPSLAERDRRAVWHPYTSLLDPDDPLPVVGARDEFLELADGSRVIDAISSWWTILHGHRPPRLMAALHAASQRIDHVLFAGATHPAAVECAELLLESVGWPDGRVFFSDNGSTAVEVALKMAYQWWCHHGEPQRTLFIGFDDGYHGDTFGAMAVGRDPLFFGRFEPLLFRAERIPLSPERLDDALNRHPGEVAAVIIEPQVQGAGGMRMHSPETLRELHRVAASHGVLFIADEVMTACRTGRQWAHEGTSPDLICAAKTLAGGILPLAVTIASRRIVAAFETEDRSRTFFHGHSFTAHPLACAVAAENLRWLRDGVWLRQSAAIEAYWRSRMAELRAKPGVIDVRVCGTILAVETDAAGGYLAETGRRMRQTALARGVLLRPLGNVLYAMPPLGTSAESLARIADAMLAAVNPLGLK